MCWDLLYVSFWENLTHSDKRRLTPGCKTNVKTAWAHSIYSIDASSIYLSFALSAENIILVVVACKYKQIVVSPLPLILGRGWISMETLTMSPPGSRNPPLSDQFTSWFPMTGDAEHMRHSFLEILIHLYSCTGIMWLKRCWRLVCLCRFIFTACQCPLHCTSNISNACSFTRLLQLALCFLSLDLHSSSR